MNFFGKIREIWLLFIKKLKMAFSFSMLKLSVQKAHLYNLTQSTLTAMAASLSISQSIHLYGATCYERIKDKCQTKVGVIHCPNSPTNLGKHRREQEKPR